MELTRFGGCKNDTKMGTESKKRPKMPPTEHQKRPCMRWQAQRKRQGVRETAPERGGPKKYFKKNHLRTTMRRRSGNSHFKQNEIDATSGSARKGKSFVEWS
jgi:hypothetical protein